eukprot:TRINITY_DN47912_c0_g1_i1.p1 TRINITY_DN47912_c0_g1~~TRINITY_DN47912_c0_g1_i1.p1  ORF type:complete len:538 (+),score=63.88 TRINITY_DN47912_c0_g1_i1:61-1614(+)
MGLGLKSVLYKYLRRYISTVAVLLTVASLVMTATLPLCWSRGTYFSENSLMIGGTVSPVGAEDVQGILNLAEDLKVDAVTVIRREAGGGVTVKEHEGGRNVVVKLESHRGFGSSAFLVMCSGDDLISVALSLTVLQRLKDKPFLGLDLYVVIVYGPYRTGVERFAEHLTAAPQHSPKLNVGFIKSAICLNFTTYTHATTHLRTLSDNSYQPNMDLVNSASALLSKTDYTVTRPPWRDYPPKGSVERDIWEAAATILPNTRVSGSGRMLHDNLWRFWGYAIDALGSDGAVHSSLRDVGVHTVTLEGVGQGGRVVDNVVTVSGVVFGLLRGMNNLCERLHQSFWIYFYTNDKHFVDYDTVQAQVWVGIAAVIAASFVPPAPTPHTQPNPIAPLVALSVFLFIPYPFEPLLALILAVILPLSPILNIFFTFAAVCSVASCTVYYAPLALCFSPLIAVISLCSQYQTTHRLLPAAFIILCCIAAHLFMPDPQHTTVIPRGFYVGVFLPYASLSLGKVVRKG